MSRLDEARTMLDMVERDTATDVAMVQTSHLSLLLRSEALYRAEALAWRQWAKDGDFVWLAHEAQEATEAFEREMGGDRG